MAALVTSIIASLLLTGVILWWGKRTAVDYVDTWGTAMVLATVVFFQLFLVFGIVPHQWLTLAENEWSFRADRLWDAWGLLTAQSQGGWFPFDITYRTLSDSIAALIYIVYLGAMIKMWIDWQGRDKKATETTEVVSSTYGRPLVKRG